MNTVQNNASANILLSIRYYESIMNCQSNTKDFIMKGFELLAIQSWKKYTDFKKTKGKMH